MQFLFLRMENKILILDFGSQVTQLIARRVRELNIYCEIHPYNSSKYNFDDYKAVILSGSPHSVRGENPPKIDLSSVKGKKPLLGICYGAQYLAHFYDGEVGSSNTREYGRANLSYINTESPLFKDVNIGSQVWMSHSDTILNLPSNYKCIASTHDVKNAAYEIEGEQTYAIQFHPEVSHTDKGRILLKNFVLNICKIKKKLDSSKTKKFNY